MISNWENPLVSVLYIKIFSFVRVKQTRSDYMYQHETLSQCWFNVGPSSTTLAQHWTSIGSMSRVFWVCMCHYATVRIMVTNCRNYPENIWDKIPPGPLGTVTTGKRLTYTRGQILVIMQIPCQENISSRCVGSESLQSQDSHLLNSGNITFSDSQHNFNTIWLHFPWNTIRCVPVWDSWIWSEGWTPQVAKS